MRYADIIVDISVESIDKTYQYRIPDEFSDSAVIGASVIIPFGNGNRKISGYIIGLSDEPKIDERYIKPIESVEDNKLVIESQLIALAGWIKKHYGATMNEALKTVMPVKKQVREVEKKTVHLAAASDLVAAEIEKAVKRKYAAKARLLEELLEAKSLDKDYCMKKLKVSASTLNLLERDGIIKITAVRMYREPGQLSKTVKSEKKVLNELQQSIADDITANYMKGDRRTCLIHGITGSGKTEIYLEVIEQVISLGKQVIMLIPEISLTFQTVRRFYERFGDRVSILNSKMSYGERHDQSERAKNGEIDIIIGPRSALFTPFQKLGLIIIDEEHENSYKSEMPPKYHARETAVERAAMCGAMVILGSATPSLEAYSRAVSGEYRLYTLDVRANGAHMPEVSIVDLRNELREGNKTIFSRLLAQKINDRLEKKQQVMLFLNRRGYAGSVTCRSCGGTVTCPHCDVSLTLHNDTKLVCHYCGYDMPKPSQCPTCGSKYIDKFGIGTQRVEEYVHKFFPAARVLRMDADTTKTKESYERILSSFADGEADILIGTQMIVKGHDFANVTLVGILAADMSLHAADYRAAERTFQLITQAAGRAGRASIAGEVVLQTYSPDHSAVSCAARADYETFFRQEYAYRKVAAYPPAAHILAVLFMGKDEKKLDACTKLFADTASKWIKLSEIDEYVSIIGPAPARIGKINDVYRRMLYFKNDEESMLVAIKDFLEQHIINSSSYSAISIQFDMDPVS